MTTEGDRIRQTRVQFADWIAGRLQIVGMTEAEAGQSIGRRAGWLRRFVVHRYPGNDLGFVEAIELVRLLGGDPKVVLGELRRGWDEG